MSNKVDEVDIKQETKYELKPKLRFPEFRNAPEWEEKRLEQISDIRTGPFGSVLHESDYVEIGTPIITVEHLDELGIKGNNLPRVSDSDRSRLSSYQLKEGDIVFSRVGSVDRCSIIRINEDGWLFSGRLLRLRIRRPEENSPQFLNQLLNYEPSKAKIRNRAVGQTMPSLNTEILNSISFHLPLFIEQQKIADCLTSLDELITAQSQKLDVLKAYKKGLMQQLFPAEGETVPRLRFPEFQDDWRIAKIGDFVESYKGGAPLTPSDFVPYSDYEVIPKKAISEGMWLKTDAENPTYCTASFFKENLQSVVDNTYLITTLRDLVPSGPSIGYIVKFAINKNYILAQGVYGLKLKKTIVSDFLIHFSKTGTYRKMMQSVMVGSTQVHIRNSVYLSLSISVPTLEEQQKIADCLSSIDEQITVQTQKLDILKVHKKGLMQQLFPAIDEVS